MQTTESQPKPIIKVRYNDKALHLLGKTLLYKSDQASGMDLCACLYIMRKYITGQHIKLRPGRYVLIPTGVSLEIPNGYEGQVRSRSGICVNEGIAVHGGIGTIDSDYRGEIYVPIINTSKYMRVIHEGERIAQLVIAPVIRPQLELVDTLDSSERGEGGFGSTGKK